MAPRCPLAPTEPCPAALPAPRVRRTHCSPIPFPMGHLSPSSSPSAVPKPRGGGLAFSRSRQRRVGRCHADAGADPGFAGEVWAAQALRREPVQRGGGSSCSAGSASWLAAARLLGPVLPLGGVTSVGTSPLGLMPLSLCVSLKLLKAGRSLDAGPNGGRTGTQRTPRGRRPPCLASSSGAARGEPRHRAGGCTLCPPRPPRGDGSDPHRRVRPHR